MLPPPHSAHFNRAQEDDQRRLTELRLAHQLEQKRLAERMAEEQVERCRKRAAARAEKRAVKAAAAAAEAAAAAQQAQAPVAAAQEVHCLACAGLKPARAGKARAQRARAPVPALQDRADRPGRAALRVSGARASAAARGAAHSAWGKRHVDAASARAAFQAGVPSAAAVAAAAASAAPVQEFSGVSSNTAAFFKVRACTWVGQGVRAVRWWGWVSLEGGRYVAALFVWEAEGR